MMRGVPIPHDPASAPRPDDPRRRHWRATRRVTAGLLVAWIVVGYGVAWFARALDFPFFGWPFSFWAAAQGGVVAFVVLVAVYAWRMDRLDRRLQDAERGADSADRSGK